MSLQCDLKYAENKNLTLSLYLCAPEQCFDHIRCSVNDWLQSFVQLCEDIISPLYVFVHAVVPSAWHTFSQALRPSLPNSHSGPPGLSCPCSNLFGFLPSPAPSGKI